MKLRAPKYYKDFTCIAERCRHSCCIGWEIDIDDATLEKYRSCEKDYSEQIRQSIELSREGAYCFRLSEGERCPHLSEKGLCNIITNLTEDYLCDICREHPRFYNETPWGMEAGLGMACEEAARIILSSDDYNSFITLSENSEEWERDFDPLPLREKLFSKLSDRSIPYEKRLCEIYSLFGISPALFPKEEWKTLISSLEYLHPRHKELFLAYKSEYREIGENKEKSLERALAYFVYRHTSDAESYEDFTASLGFALFCERLLASLVKEADSFEDICDLARIISEELEYSEDNTEEIKQLFF